MGDITGKTAIVTGASKGIGAAIAKALAAAGASVVVNYATSKDGADTVVGDITAKGGKAVAVQGDVSKAADVTRLFEEAKTAFGAVDILVNNAGVYGFGSIEGATEAEYRRQFDTNVWGPIQAIRTGLGYFAAGASIINISTVVSSNPVDGALIYSASKAANDVITRVLAKELGPRGIRVNTIAPGGTLTEGVIAAGIEGSDFQKAMVDATPLGRFGEPDDIAKVAVFLASDDAAWVTGEYLRVAGGYR